MAQDSIVCCTAIGLESSKASRCDRIVLLSRVQLAVHHPRGKIEALFNLTFNKLQTRPKGAA